MNDVPKGYTAEELERDSPYNQWMYEDRDPDFEDESEADICVTCNGSGEGQHDGTRCSCCKGRGVK